MESLKLLTTGMFLFLASIIQAQNNNPIINAPCSDMKKTYAENAKVNYYFLPDVEAYYDVNSSMFIYREGNIWVHKTKLPVKFKNYDLYCGYKINITGIINFDMPAYYSEKHYRKNHKNESLTIVKENNNNKMAQLQVE